MKLTIHVPDKSGVCVCVRVFTHEAMQCVYVYMCDLMYPCVCVWSVCITGGTSLFDQSGSCQSQVWSWDHLTDWCDVVVHSASRSAKTAPLLGSSLGLIITPSSTYNSAPSHRFPISPNIVPVSFPNFILFWLQELATVYCLLHHIQYSIFNIWMHRLQTRAKLPHAALSKM